jgi:radical SAM superfamily enzyme YgiQ (UPF0313 family)
MSQPFRVTLIHPCVGRRIGERHRDYVRSWRMQPLPPALIAGMCPPDVDKRFYDDRFEPIPYDEPTDLVCLSVETYTARRSYQIASQYRNRGVPVVMGGFHPTLCPEEAGRYAEALVVGEAEGLFSQLLDDFRAGTPQRVYRAAERPSLSVRPDRSIFRGRHYLPIGLVEFARGCRFKCDFCAITSAFQAKQTHYAVEQVLAEVERVRRPGQMIFFIDDNITSTPEAAKDLFRALIGRGVRWVGQSAITAAWDKALLELMKRSGCLGILVGLESLDQASLKTMNKEFNLLHGGAAQALANLREAGLRVYGTFVFGYDSDTLESCAATVRFAREHGLFISAFNHITPFPGTPLFARLNREGRLHHEAWWLDPSYRYNQVPFTPANLTPRELETSCLEARREFYSWSSIWQRSRNRVNLQTARMTLNYFVINAMHQRDVVGRSGMPLGDLNEPLGLVEAGG